VQVPDAGRSFDPQLSVMIMKSIEFVREAILQPVAA
jgi:hypothetical protein